MGVEVLVLLVMIILLSWAYSIKRHSYWSLRGVSCPPALPILGHFHKSIFINKRLWKDVQENYAKFYNSSMYGLYEFFNPVLITWDLEILRDIMVKNFDHFSNRREFNLRTGHERDEMMMEMLSLKSGEEWKRLRAIMTPTFTSGKIKSMFPLVCDKADALVNYTVKQAAKNPQIDIKKNFGKYTMDTIASCAFGIECNSLVDENAEFTRKVEVFFTMKLSSIFKGMFFNYMPRLFKVMGLCLNPPEADFFIEVVKQTVVNREAGKKRGDFLDLMLEARDSSGISDSKHVLRDISLVAQSVLFLIAGYDTTASLLAFSSFLLAKHKEQQQRLRDEIRQMVAEHGDITYQSIMGAKLLDACIQETLRLYPPLVLAERACTKSFMLPGTDITLKPGDIVEVPIWSIHHDPHHWPDPEAFIPDRFLPENKGNIRPFTHIPFGVGPRNCIAMRFALLEAKVALAKLLMKAEMDTVLGHEELELETANGLIRPKDGVRLLVKPVSE